MPPPPAPTNQDPNIPNGYPPPPLPSTNQGAGAMAQAAPPGHQLLPGFAYQPGLARPSRKSSDRRSSDDAAGHTYTDANGVIVISSDTSPANGVASHSSSVSTQTRAETFLGRVGQEMGSPGPEPRVRNGLTSHNSSVSTQTRAERFLGRIGQEIGSQDPGAGSREHDVNRQTSGGG